MRMKRERERKKEKEERMMREGERKDEDGENSKLYSLIQNSPVECFLSSSEKEALEFI